MNMTSRALQEMFDKSSDHLRFEHLVALGMTIDKSSERRLRPTSVRTREDAVVAVRGAPESRTINCQSLMLCNTEIT